MVEPYYSDDWVTLYHGDALAIVPSLDPVSAIVTDPPYGETSLEWDRWPEGWPSIAADAAPSMWVFGSMRMFMEQASEFTKWQLSQDVVWEKHNGSGLHADRFRRVHEHALHWYHGKWSEIRHVTPTTPTATGRQTRMKSKPEHMKGGLGNSVYRSEDGGPLLMRSVLYARSMHGVARHPTEKPVGVLTPLIEYVSAPGDVVLDLFAGSGSTLDAARQVGRRSVGIEQSERYCEVIARRLDQGVLDFAAGGD